MEEKQGGRTVLVTGAAGWLAQRVVQRLSSRGGIKIISTYNRTAPPPPLPRVTNLPMDILDETVCKHVFASHRPDVVLHLAALTNTSKCQADAVEAARVNAPCGLFNAIRATCPGTRLVFCSTDLCYNGVHPPFLGTHPDALSLPLNIYAQSKLAGERDALACVPDCLVLRLSNMIGPGGGKFLDFLRASMASGAVTGLRADERRSFVWVEEVCTLLCQIAALQDDAGISGVYNVGGPEGLTRLQLGLLLAECAGRKVRLDEGTGTCTGTGGVKQEADAGDSPWIIAPQTAETHPPLFPSPLDVTMDSDATCAAFGIRFSSMKTALTTILELERDA